MKLNSFQQNLHNAALKLAETFRKTESDLIEILQRIDDAEVYLALGYSSLYTYANECLGLSEANSYAFTSVARKSKQIPELKTQIQLGNLSVAKARRILSVITPENQKEWISKAATLAKADLEREVIKVNPEAERRESIRPLSEDRFSLKLGISEELLKKLKRAQVLLMNKRRKNLTLEQTLDALTDGFLESQDPVRKAKRIAEKTFCPGKKSKNYNSPEIDNSEVVKTPKDPSKGVFGVFHPQMVATNSKRKPLNAAIKNAIFLRDEGQCQFQAPHEKKCGGMAYVEIHHRRPVSKGGGE